MGFLCFYEHLSEKGEAVCFFSFVSTSLKKRELVVFGFVRTSIKKSEMVVFLFQLCFSLKNMDFVAFSAFLAPRCKRGSRLLFFSFLSSSLKTVFFCFVFFWGGG